MGLLAPHFKEAVSAAVIQHSSMLYSRGYVRFRFINVNLQLRSENFREYRIIRIDETSQYFALLISLICVLSMFILNCGQPEDYYPVPDIEYRLVVVDSIGVEFGEDEYMFAWPTDPTYSKDSRILIVDRLKHTVLVFSPDGEYLTSIGRAGEGPGEFHMPNTVETLQNGNVLVASSDKYAVFDSTFSCIDQYMATGYSMMHISEILDDGCLIGTRMTLEGVESGPVFSHILGKWQMHEDKPLIVFHSFENTWDLNDPETIDYTEGREDGLIHCASTDGHVFYSRSSIDELIIHCFDPSGTEYLTIEDENIHRVRKTQDELDAEMQSRMSFFNAMAARAGVSNHDLDMILDPYRRVIKEMFVDSLDRLWVRMGIYPGTVYRVYDFDGNVLFYAEVDYVGNQLDLNNWTINGDENGILAVNESMEYYQRVYVLELRPAN